MPGEWPRTCGRWAMERPPHDATRGWLIEPPAGREWRCRRRDGTHCGNGDGCVACRGIACGAPAHGTGSGPRNPVASPAVSGLTLRSVVMPGRDAGFDRRGSRPSAEFLAADGTRMLGVPLSVSTAHAIWPLQAQWLLRDRAQTDRRAESEERSAAVPAADSSAFRDAGRRESHLTQRRPGAQNDATEFPQQLSVFLAGALSPHIGF